MLSVSILLSAVRDAGEPQTDLKIISNENFSFERVPPEIQALLFPALAEKSNLPELNLRRMKF